MKLVRYVSAAAAVALSSCASGRYEDNLSHVRVNPKLHLSRPEVEQIVRAISDSTAQPMIAITWENVNRERDKLSAFTGWPEGNTHKDFQVFHLRKSNDVWYIKDHGEISPGLMQALMFN